MDVIESIHLVVGHLLFLFLSTFPDIRLFSKELDICVIYQNLDNFSLVISSLSKEFWIDLFVDPSVCFLGSPQYSQQSSPVAD